MRRNLNATGLDMSQRTDRGAGSRAWMAALALPLTLLGAVLYLVGMWSPWLYDETRVTGGFGFGATSAGVTSGTAASFTGLLALVHHSSGAERLVFGWFGWLGVLALVWDALPLIGIMVGLGLWAQRGASRAQFGVYAGWLVFASAVTGAGIYGTFAVLAGDHCATDCTQFPLIVHGSAAWGIWLTLGALALGWGGFVALARRRMLANGDGSVAAHPPTGTPAPTRPWLALVGAGTFTLGATIWALGLLLVPWVTAGCSGLQFSWTHFVRGTCTGLDGYDVLSAGLVNGLGDSFDTAISSVSLDPYHIILLLTVAGLVLTVLLWQPGRARARVRTILAVATVWALLIALECVAGWVGTTYRVGHQGILTFGSAPQVVGPGLWLCVIGIVLVGAGTGAGWLGARSAAHGQVNWR